MDTAVSGVNLLYPIYIGASTISTKIGTTSRAEFEGLCAELGLLPDGAIEIINEAAFEHFDAPLLEDDEPLEINPDIVEEINI